MKQCVLWGLVAAALTGCPASRGGDGGTGDAGLQLLISGVGSLGIFDPAPTWDADAGQLWMSYSAVEPSTIAANTLISTRLAHSTDAGFAWSDDGVLNQAIDISLPLAPPNDQGTWEYEVSRLFYDPFAPASERWGVLFFRYLTVNGNRLFEHGWIGLRTAPAPAVTAWSAERKLFVGSLYTASDDSIIGAPEVRLPQLHGDLSGCLAASEPGVLALSDALYVSLYCAGAAGRQVLVRRPRATGVWEYAGTFSTDADATALGYDNFSATELAQENGKTWLVMSPESSNRYQGCMVFEVQDLATAALVRTGGALAPVKHVELLTGGLGFGGACGYDSHSSSGLIYGELFDTAPQFRLFVTGVKLSE